MKKQSETDGQQQAAKPVSHRLVEMTDSGQLQFKGLDCSTTTRRRPQQLTIHRQPSGSPPVFNRRRPPPLFDVIHASRQLPHPTSRVRPLDLTSPGRAAHTPARASSYRPITLLSTASITVVVVQWTVSDNNNRQFISHKTADRKETAKQHAARHDSKQLHFRKSCQTESNEKSTSHRW